MATARRYPTVTLLPNGKVLIAWGLDGTTGYLASVVLLRPASYEPDLIMKSIITNPTPSNRDIPFFGESRSIPGKFSIAAGISPDENGNYYVTDTLKIEAIY